MLHFFSTHLILPTILFFHFISTVQSDAESQKFLYDNSLLDDVITLPSTLQYKIVKNGPGKFHPTLHSPCLIHYSGKLVDGTTFDSSYDRNQAATFKPSGVVKGWTEILQMMVEGDEFEVYVPSKLAYGNKGTHGIPGGATLIFHIHLIEISGNVKKKKNDNDDDPNNQDNPDAATEQFKERAIPIAPINRTQPIGTVCHNRLTCGHNGACVSNGFGLILDDKYDFITHRQDTGEDKFLHNIVVANVEPNGIAFQKNVQVGDFVEHVNKIRDGSAHKTMKRIIKLQKKGEIVQLGLIRSPDTSIRDLDYGGNFNITLELKETDKLGLKLGNLGHDVWGVKVRKVYRDGVAFTDVPGHMFLKKDVIRGVNGRSLPTHGTVQDFVQMLQEEKLKSTTVCIHGNRPLPEKNSVEWKSIRQQHLTIQLSPPLNTTATNNGNNDENANDNDGNANANEGDTHWWSKLGICSCRGSWAGRSCEFLRIMGGSMTQILETSPLDQLKYETIYDELSRAPGGIEERKKESSTNTEIETKNDKDEDIDVLGKLTDHVAMNIYEICDVIDGTSERVCVYHGLFLSQFVSDSNNALDVTAWRVGYATSFSPFGRFHNFVQSPWVLTSDTVPSIRTFPSNNINDSSKSSDSSTSSKTGSGGTNTFFVQTYMNMLHIGRLSSMNITTSTLDISSEGGTGIVGRKGEWDEMIGDGSIVWNQDVGYVLTYVGTAEDGTTSIGIAVSKEWNTTFVRPQHQTDEQNQNEDQQQPHGRIVIETSNVTNFHDPFMYIDEEDAWHLLFMGTSLSVDQDNENNKDNEDNEDQGIQNGQEKEQKDGAQYKTAVYHVSSSTLLGPWSVPLNPSLETGQYKSTPFRSKQGVVEHLDSIRRPNMLFSSVTSTKAVAFYVSAKLKSSNEMTTEVIEDGEELKTMDRSHSIRHVIMGASTGHTD